MCLLKSVGAQASVLAALKQTGFVFIHVCVRSVWTDPMQDPVPQLLLNMVTGLNCLSERFRKNISRIFQRKITYNYFWYLYSLKTINKNQYPRVCITFFFLINTLQTYVHLDGSRSSVIT